METTTLLPPHRLGGLRAGASHALDADTFAAQVASDIRALRKQGLSLRAIASSLNLRGLPARRGGRWTASQIRRLLMREKTSVSLPADAVPRASEAVGVSLPAAQVRVDLEPPTPAPQMPDILVSLHGKVTGPFTLAQLAEMLDRGEVTSVTPAKRRSEARWAPVLRLLANLNNT